jgi:hypothetical protein
MAVMMLSPRSRFRERIGFELVCNKRAFSGNASSTCHPERGHFRTVIAASDPALQMLAATK